MGAFFFFSFYERDREAVRARLHPGRVDKPHTEIRVSTAAAGPASLKLLMQFRRSQATQAKNISKVSKGDSHHINL